MGLKDKVKCGALVLGAGLVINLFIGYGMTELYGNKRNLKFLSGVKYSIENLETVPDSMKNDYFNRYLEKINIKLDSLERENKLLEDKASKWARRGFVYGWFVE